MPVSIILLREATAGPSDQVINTWRSLATSSFSFLSTEAITHVWVLCLTGLFNSYWLSVPFFLHRLSESLLPSETHAHGFFLRQSSSRIFFLPLAGAADSAPSHTCQASEHSVF